MKSFYLILKDITKKNISVNDLTNPYIQFVKNWYPQSCNYKNIKDSFQKKINNWNKNPLSISRLGVYEVSILLKLSSKQCNQLMAKTCNMLLSPRNVEDAFLIYSLNNHYTLEKFLNELVNLFQDDNTYNLFCHKYELKNKTKYGNVDYDTETFFTISNSYTTKKMYTHLNTFNSFKEYLTIYQDMFGHFSNSSKKYLNYILNFLGKGKSIEQWYEYVYREYLLIPLDKIICKKYDDIAKENDDNYYISNALSLNLNSISNQRMGNTPVDRSLLLILFLLFVFLDRKTNKEDSDKNYLSICNRLLQFTFFEELTDGYPLDDFVKQLLLNDSMEKAIDILVEHNENIFIEVNRCIKTNRDFRRSNTLKKWEKAYFIKKGIKLYEIPIKK